MANVSVRRRIRPLRFAFLIDHRDAAELRRAIQVNTILWAGMFNAIIPIFRRTPRSWQTSRAPAEVVAGYLDTFEPDFVITGSRVDASEYAVPSQHSVSLASMLTREGIRERGMGVMDLYRWRYRKEFRFIQKDPPVLHHVTPPNRRLALFTAAVFGEFPPTPLDFFATGFRDLGGENVRLSAESYGDELRKAISPLALGASGLDEHGSFGPRRAFLLLDPTNVGDLIDFWNLRALGWRIAAIPVEWLHELAPRIARTIRAEHQPDKLLLRSFTSAHLLRARSVTEATLMAFAKAIGVSDDSVVLQTSLPRLWDPEARDGDRANRIELWAGDDETRGDLRDDWLSFNTTGPEFAERTWVDRPRVANVITFRSYELPNVADIVPKEIADLDGLLRWVGQANMIRNSSEGLAVLTEGHERGVTWRVPHSVRVFTEWFKPKGDLKLSGAGKIARRMIQILGGPEQARLISVVELVRIFGRATESASRDIPHSDLLALLLRSMHNHKERVERRIEALIRQKIIKLGIRLYCDQCAQQNWFALDELREHLTCQWCLDELPFPSAMPPKQPCWSYRPLGPFAARGHAHGAYVVAAAIRIFRELSTTPRTTWIPSFTLKRTGGEVEADFGVLWQSGGAQPKRPQLVLGECKTFDMFEAKDIVRMKRLAAAFPGAVLVFATFNDRLKSAEAKRLAELAVWGRRGWRNPVMVLTARELTSDFGPPFCWAHSGIAGEKKLYEAVTKAPVPHTSLRRLADATQQLHLNMPPDEDWPHYDKP